MPKATLVIMAAGMGSRFGGSKQTTAVDDAGHTIMDHSIFDARRAGFDRVVCIIKPEMYEDFHRNIGARIQRHIDLRYAYQRLDALPTGFAVPEGRQKPWGTAHAVLCAAPQIDSPFAVINADDFYGQDAFVQAAAFLQAPHGPNEHAMVGYRIENTLTENGHVSRGVCAVDDRGYLQQVTERTRVQPCPGGAVAAAEDGGELFIPAGTTVSMNLWAFQSSILGEMERRFGAFLQENLPQNPLKCEYYLPLIPNALVHEGSATVQVLRSSARWYGVTYREDLPGVVQAIAQMRAAGQYPARLWEDCI